MIFGINDVNFGVVFGAFALGVCRLYAAMRTFGRQMGPEKVSGGQRILLVALYFTDWPGLGNPAPY